jgi:hypothetical protein
MKNLILVAFLIISQAHANVEVNQFDYTFFSMLDSMTSTRPRSMCDRLRQEKEFDLEKSLRLLGLPLDSVGLQVILTHRLYGNHTDTFKCTAYYETYSENISFIDLNPTFNTKIECQDESKLLLEDPRTILADIYKLGWVWQGHCGVQAIQLQKKLNL